MDYTKLKPLNGIIVLKMKTQDVSKGGIHFIEERRLDHATTVAVGPGEWIQKPGSKPEFRHVGVKVGDTVVVGPGSGVILEIEVDGETEPLTFLSENDIVAVIRKEPH